MFWTCLNVSGLWDTFEHVQTKMWTCLSMSRNSLVVLDMLLDMFLDTFNVSIRSLDMFKRVRQTGHILGHVVSAWTCFGHVHSDTFNVSENVSQSLVGISTAVLLKYPFKFDFALVNRI